METRQKSHKPNLEKVSSSIIAESIFRFVTMSSLDGLLQLQLRGSPLAGETPLASPTRPTVSGLQWLAAPSGVAGLAYRVNGSTLERLSITESETTVEASCALKSHVSKIAVSVDGRLVAVACLDGSLQCFDSTSSSLTHRWTIKEYTNVVSDPSTPPSSDRTEFTTSIALPRHTQTGAGA